jgi:hypothetical protein
MLNGIVFARPTFTCPVPPLVAVGDPAAADVPVEGDVPVVDCPPELLELQPTTARAPPAAVAATTNLKARDAYLPDTVVSSAGCRFGVIIMHHNMTSAYGSTGSESGARSWLV